MVMDAEAAPGREVAPADGVALVAVLTTGTASHPAEHSRLVRRLGLIQSVIPTDAGQSGDAPARLALIRGIAP